jgi:hypothetical protein
MGKLTELLTHPDELVPMVRQALALLVSAPLLNCTVQQCRGPKLRDPGVAPHRPTCRPTGGSSRLPFSMVLVSRSCAQASMYLAARRAKQLPKEPGLAFCYDMLNRVSRRWGGCQPLLPPLSTDHEDVRPSPPRHPKFLL